MDEWRKKEWFFRDNGWNPIMGDHWSWFGLMWRTVVAFVLFVLLVRGIGTVL